MVTVFLGFNSWNEIQADDGRKETKEEGPDGQRARADCVSCAE
jgi:hypothetical protein